MSIIVQKLMFPKVKQTDLRPPKDRLIAILDIGSNSVRLVVFKGLLRNPKYVFNEGILCGLGRSVSTTGRMDDLAVKRALSTLKRFSELCHEMQVDQIEAFATAAVRDSVNGPEFIKTVREECGFNVEIFSGKVEARNSAYGIISAFPKTTGIVGDLGGGSLELIHVIDDKVIDYVSLPIGPLRLLGEKTKIDPEEVSYIQEALEDVPWLSECQNLPFYMIGGSWRLLTRLYIHHKKYPLEILHGFEMEPKSILKYSHKLTNKDPDNIKKVKKSTKTRGPLIPTAATILYQVISHVNPSKVICSDNGIREGVLFKMLNHKVRAKDPFLKACKSMSDQTKRFPEHAQKLMAWMDGVFENESEEDKRLRLASAKLSDIGWEGHPDFRAAKVFKEVVYGRFTGIDHRGRLIVGIALYLLYGGRKSRESFIRMKNILSPQDYKTAVIIGYSLGLGQLLTGGTSHPLDYSELKIVDKELHLILPNNKIHVVSDLVKRRLKKLAKKMGLNGKVMKV